MNDESTYATLTEHFSLSSIYSLLWILDFPTEQFGHAVQVICVDHHQFLFHGLAIRTEILTDVA